MKKLLTGLLLCIAIFSCTVCGGGDVREVGIREVESEIYTFAEIGDGIDEVLDYFKKSFDGCTLRELQYIGDEENLSYRDFALRNGYDDVLVLTSTFDVDESGGDGSLNPNDTYKNWKWILVRGSDGQWKHLDHGY